MRTFWQCLALVVFLTGCGLPVQHPEFTGLPETQRAETFTCCADPERQPAWFADLAIALSEPLEPLFDPGPGTGLMAAHPEAIDQAKTTAQPMDILALSAKSHAGSRFFSGWFTHTAIYIGNERKLRAAGLWSHPAITPHHDAIRGGMDVIHGIAPRVRLDRLDDVLSQRDAVAILRPTIGRREKGLVASRALSTLNYGFDFTYNLNTCDAFACTEVVARSYKSIDFPLRELLGEPVLLPDDVAAKGIRNEGLRLVAYIEAREASWVATGTRGAMERIAGFWGPSPVGPISPVSSSLKLAACRR